MGPSSTSTGQELLSRLPPLEQIARSAGAAIMDVYRGQGEIQVETKADESPLTQADRAAHQVIVQGLAGLTPEIPVLSEESALPSFHERRQWPRYWLVDPLDGTKEFISRNGEFTVNIALIEHQVAVLGVVYVPASGVLYQGVPGEGAWRVDASGREQIRTRAADRQQALKVVMSRRHGGEALESLLQRATQYFSGVEPVNVGSSLKFCMLAEGKADWYPRQAPTSEWDTAAAQAVLEAAGGMVVDESMQPLRYNSKESVLNPFFHGFGDPAVDWRQILQ